MTVGAYERDNFGDSLFYLVARKYLDKDDLVAPASIMAKLGVDTQIGESIIPYASLLETHKWSCAWVLGGEIGEASLDACLMMDLGSGYSNIISSAEPGLKQKIRDAITYNGSISTLGYLPNIEKAGHKGKFFVTSVGLSGLANMPTGIQEAALRVLKTTHYLTVRDKNSYDFCIANGLKRVELVPDLVQSIKMHYPSLPKDDSIPSGYIAVQFSKQYHDEASKEKIVNVLKSIQADTSSSIVFIAAGTAPGHDDIKLYESLTELIPNSVVSHRRDPLEIAAIIANAKLTISTSLHVRIVSIAYAVPRVSLRNKKVNDYAETWDSTMPYNVSAESVRESVQMLSGVDKLQLEDVGSRLASLVDDSVRSQVKNIPTDDSKRTLESIQLEAALMTNGKVGELLMGVGGNKRDGFGKRLNGLLAKARRKGVA